MLTCKEVAQLVSDSLDRDLSFVERVIVRFHLLYCLACRRYRGQVRFLRTAIRRYLRMLEEAPPADAPVLSEAARERLNRALQQG